jgi:hypothetical protein
VNRVVSTTSRQASREVRDLLQSALAAELLNPSSRIWLVSAWVTDASVIDNAGGEFSGLVPSWPNREIRLSEVIGTFLTWGARVHVVTNTHSGNGPFAHALQAVADALAVTDELRVSIDDALTTQEEQGLHRKRLVTERFVIWGSMNFTRSGMERNAEDVSFAIDPPTVARAVNEMEQLYGDDRW